MPGWQKPTVWVQPKRPVKTMPKPIVIFSTPSGMSAYHLVRVLTQHLPECGANMVDETKQDHDEMQVFIASPEGDEAQSKRPARAMTKRVKILATHKGLSAIDIAALQMLITPVLADAGIADDPEYEVHVVDGVTQYQDETTVFIAPRYEIDRDQPCLKQADGVRTYRGKCKRMRREARGW